MATKCAVNRINYDLGCLAPAILIIIVLSFMNKRVRLAPGLWNGRPALPVPIDFLGDDKNRFAVAFAFGATAASCFYMFFKVDAVSSNLKNDSWSKAFRGVAMTLTYGIVNYPFLACLKAEYKIIGYTMGFIYSFIRLIVDLVMYFGCTYNKTTETYFKSKNLGYLLFFGILLNIPVVLCTFTLVGSYAALLYRELKKSFAQGTASFRNIFQREELKDESLTSATDTTHVFLLFSNRLHEERVVGNNVPWYISLKNKLYQTRTDFKFSTQFLSAYLVSWIFVYQVTVILVAEFDILKVILQRILQDYFTYQKASSVSNLFYDYLVASTVLAMIVAALQLCFLLRSHRSDVLKTYRTRSGLLPDEILHPKMIVGKSLRYCGYQIAFTGLGLLVNAMALFFFLTPIWLLHLMSMFWTSGQILALVRSFVLWILPLIIASILTWLTLVMLSLFVFRDRNYPDFSISIDNRRLFNTMSYFFFFFNILVGVWSGLMLILKGILIGLVFFPRLDRTMMMRGYRKWDKGYMAYIGFLNVLVAFKHPVMLCFCQMLLDETRGISKEKNPNTERPRVSTKALNHWFLAVLLMRNPSLVRYRKQGVQQGLQSASTNDVIIEMPAIVCKDDFPPLERLKSLDVY